MGRIKRNSILVIAEAQTNNSAFLEGEICSNYRNHDGIWVSVDSNGKRWRNLVSNLRNDSFYRILEQYSLSDIICYLMNRNTDYQTVATEIIVDAIKETLNTIQVATLDDVYEYISQHLI